MHGFAYGVALVTCAVIVGAALAGAMRRWGLGGLLVTAGASAVALLGIGYLDYSSQAPIETPLRTYVLSSVVSTSLAAIAVAGCAWRRLHPAWQAALAGTLWLGSTVLILGLTMFI